MNQPVRLRAVLPFLAWMLLFDLHAQESTSLDNQIQRAINQKKYAEADDLVDGALSKVNPKIPSQHRLYGTYLATKGELALRQKKYQASVDWASKAEPVLDQYPPDLLMINNLITLAYAHIFLQDDESEEIASEKLLKAEKLQARLKSPGNAIQLGDRYMSVGNELLKANQSIESANAFAVRLYGMATLLFQKGNDPVRNRVAIAQSLAVMEKIQREEEEEDENDKKVAVQPKKANPKAATVSDPQKKSKANLVVRNSWLALLTQMPYASAAEKARMGRNEAEWEKSYQATVAQNEENSLPAAIAHGTIGNLYLTVKGNYGKAESHLSQAIAILKQLDALTTVMGAGYLRDLSLAYMLSGKYDKVAAPLAEGNKVAKTLHQSVFGLTAFSEETKELFLGIDWGLQMSLAFTDYMVSRKPGAYMPLMQQLSYDASLYMNGLLLDEARAVRNSIEQRADPKLTSLYTAWLAQKQLIANSPVAERKAAIANGNETEEELAEAFSDVKVLKANAAGVDWKQVRDRLKPGQAAVSFVRFRAFPFKGPMIDSLTKPEDIRYAALVIRSGYTYPQFVSLGTEKRLQDLLISGGTPASSYTTSRGGVVSASTVAHAPGDSLYQLVWKPVERLLLGTTRVYYSTEGLLSRVAFAAIPLPGTKAETPIRERYLSGRHELYQLFSTRQLVQGIQPLRLQSATSIALMGGVDYGTVNTGQSTATGVTPKPSLNYLQTAIQRMKLPPFPYLNGTLSEIEAIKRAFPHSELITGTAASEKRLRQFSGQSPVVLHLATHGLYSKPEPKQSDQKPDEAMMRTALVLAQANNLWHPKRQLQNGDDGLLTAYEIADLNLSQTRLVVLSACETALGDLRGPEGVFGLPRAFRMAGVEKMLLSLWPVNDVRTQQLMTLFYINLKAGYEVREAFSKAQLDIQKQVSDPAIWAAFVLIQ